MRQLKVMEHISLDGVIQQTADGVEFPHLNWTDAYRSPAGAEAVLAAYGGPVDLLLGRRTYDLWSGYWPHASGPMAEVLNAATKYVVTHHPDTLEWGPFEAVGPDLVEDVRKLKAADGRPLLLWGSSTLTSTLLEHGVVDELTLVTYPVFLGTGKPLLAQGFSAQHLTLVDSQTMITGVMLNTYRPGFREA